MSTTLAEKEKRLQMVGLVLFILAVLTGAGLLLVGKVVLPLFSKNPAAYFFNMCIAVGLAFPACAVYLCVPLIVDRYDPEPWWCLAIALLWGIFPADGYAFWLNTFNAEIAEAVLGRGAGAIVGPVLSAPIVEEGLKGLGVLGIYLFLRRQFDGVVDGVIYGTFIGLGFAAAENISYYTRYGLKGELLEVFIIRGVLAPWGHPLYTSMTGIGIGIARETNQTWLKFVAPVGGYAVAVLLHMIWNGTSVVGGFLRMNLFFLALPVWLLFLMAFSAVVIYLVYREGKIIERFLQDEVLMGNLTKDDVALVTSPFGRLKALFGASGRVGRKFVDVASRLALTKWHAARAMEGRKQTLSFDLVAPLRQEMAQLKGQMRR